MIRTERFCAASELEGQMNRIAKLAVAFGAAMAGGWVATGSAQATTFDLGEIHAPGWVGLSQTQGGSGSPGFEDFPADQYDFTVDNQATLVAAFSLSLLIPQQTPADYLDISLYETDPSGTHLLTSGSGNDSAGFAFDVEPGHAYSFLVADGFFNNPPETSGYGGILTFSLTPTPIPPALLLFGTALLTLGGCMRQRNRMPATTLIA